MNLPCAAPSIDSGLEDVRPMDSVNIGERLSPLTVIKALVRQVVFATRSKLSQLTLPSSLFS